MKIEKTIEHTIAHLNGYAKILEAKNIPCFAVYENIANLKLYLRKLQKLQNEKI